MNVISKSNLKKLMKKHPQAAKEVTAWYKIARAARWHCLEDARVQFPSADLVGRVLIFDILHNDLRLLTIESFRSQRLYVKALMTHKEYDRKEWVKWNSRP